MTVTSDGSGRENQSFGALLRRYRLAAGLTQEELAERANLSVTGVSALERGVRNRPHQITIDLLVGALSLSSDEQKVLESTARWHGPLAGPHQDNLQVGMYLGAIPPMSIVGRAEEVETLMFYP